MKNKETGFIIGIELQSVRVKLLYWCMLIFALVIAAICLLPPVWIMVSAFKDTREFFQVPPTIIPKSFHIEKLALVWSKTNFGSAMVSSVVMVAGDVICSLFFNGICGYALSRLKPKGSKLIMLLVLWTIMLPTSVNTVPLFMTFIDMPVFHWNLIDTYFPMWMMAGANAFYVLLFKSFFDGISMSYLEAARIDGCGDMGIFVRIIVPLSMPILATVAIFTVNGSWGAFFWPYLLLKNQALQTVGVVLYNLKTAVAIDEYMVALIFVLLPPSIIFIIFQKQIMGGVMMGGIKG